MAKSKQLPVRMGDDLYDKIRKIAEERELSMSYIVKDIVKKNIDEYARNILNIEETE